ncbi:MAG: lipoate--protein ligase family protein [SAR324 cluster bacterium]|nr:lipoate--protein ligase family protein [SAR324 cluster bacterium]
MTEIKAKLNLIRLIPYKKESAKFNMAADVFLLKNSALPTLRFYGWKKPTLSFGKNKTNLSDIDFDFCKANNFDFVLRPSGGKSVFHSKELTYCLTCPLHIFPYSILETYRIINQAFIKALQNQLKINLIMTPEKKRAAHSSSCFQEISSWEINQDGKKIVGSAQLRKAKSILQHGSILLDLDFSLWQKIWPAISKPQMQKRITSLNLLHAKKHSPAKLADLIFPDLCLAWQTKSFTKALSSHERRKINLIAKEWPSFPALKKHK